MLKVSPCLWFEGQAEEAAKHYTSVFPNSRIVEIATYPEGGPSAAGSVMTVAFELDGVSFMGLNAGPHDRFNDAISLSVDCEDQSEVDHYWEKLGAGGRYVQCGWLKDRFGVSWQIVPKILPRVFASSDGPARARAMAAMMRMVKIDVATIEEAVRG